MALIEAARGERTTQNIAAGKLHTTYKERTGDSSLVAWQKLTRSIGIPDSELLLRHLLSSEVLHPPRIALITPGNAESWLKDARGNPESTRFPVSKRDEELSARINAREHEVIPPAYIAYTMYLYGILSEVSKSNPDLWYSLPIAGLFTEQWYTEIAKTGRLRHRLFRYDSPLFLKWFYRMAERVGEYDAEKIVAKAQAYLDANPQPIPLRTAETCK